MSISDTHITINFPKAIEADDYHEFKYMQDFLRESFDNRINCTELGFDEDLRKYIGLLYIDESDYNYQKRRFNSGTFNLSLKE